MGSSPSVTSDEDDSMGMDESMDYSYGVGEEEEEDEVEDYGSDYERNPYGDGKLDHYVSIQYTFQVLI